MKATVRTPEMLVIDDAPWMLGGLVILVILGTLAGALGMLFEGEIAGGLLAALIGGGLGFGAFAAFVRRTRLVLNRATGRAELFERTVFRSRFWDCALTEIDRAWVETSKSDDSTTQRPVLILTSGAHRPLTPVYSGGQGAQRAVHAINDWLGRSA